MFISLCVTLALAFNSLAPSGDVALAKSVGDALERAAAADEFSGIVVITRGGRPVFRKSYGFADREAKAPIDMQTRFNLGSMNKMFTAVAVAQLAERGKLSFDDTVARHLPDYPNKEVAAKVTIHHLLTHTSGLGDYFSPAFFAARAKITKVSELLPFFAEKPLEFEPGARFRYSNAGFVVLGLVVERASGEDYYDYVRRNVFKPAGMTNTDSFEHGARVANIATPYTRVTPTGPVPAGEPRRARTEIFKGTPAGGGYSTAEDMLKFAAALTSHKLLGAKHTEIVTTGKVAMGPFKYAYGFGEHANGGRRSFGHNGGSPGVGAYFQVYPATGHVFVLLTNYDPEVMEKMSRQIERLINGA
jgi:CubicO group peptidase (beta-lactamase class C family)